MHPSEPNTNRERRFVFDEVAELYARARPTYPPELVEDIIRESGLHAGARILELGCGPGNASVLFAGRGYRLLCLEPGPRLADVARRRLAGDGNARVAVTTFEDWPLEPEAFELLFAAQSFHWMDPTVRFTKAARALKPDGTLAIFANRPLRGSSPVDDRIREGIRRACAAYRFALDRPQHARILPRAVCRGAGVCAGTLAGVCVARGVHERRVRGSTADAFRPSGVARRPGGRLCSTRSAMQSTRAADGSSSTISPFSAGHGARRVTAFRPQRCPQSLSSLSKSPSPRRTLSNGRGLRSVKSFCDGSVGVGRADVS